MSQSNLNNILSCVSSPDQKLNSITKAEENPHDQSIGGANETDLIVQNLIGQEHPETRLY